mmetsp:Transcript_10506/g.28741  ORF Transcript_10506/g.28741 Transcript_10506/m.28741 type:complete len:207 (+) Transcript_10506:2330-2950(+)
MAWLWHPKKRCMPPTCMVQQQKACWPSARSTSHEGSWTTTVAPYPLPQRGSWRQMQKRRPPTRLGLAAPSSASTRACAASTCHLPSNKLQPPCWRRWPPKLLTLPVGPPLPPPQGMIKGLLGWAPPCQIKQGHQVHPSLSFPPAPKAHSLVRSPNKTWRQQVEHCCMCTQPIEPRDPLTHSQCPRVALPYWHWPQSWPVCVKGSCS